MIRREIFGEFTYGLDPELDLAELKLLSEQLQTPAPSGEQSLNGRSAARFLALGSWGKVVIKTYRRGGFWGKLFISRFYLRLGRTRPEQEFLRLQMVRRLGVRAPRPLCFAVHGRFLYTGWLVSQEIEHNRSLAELAIEDPERARAVIPELVRQMQTLIEAGVFHVDLHPGNVLVTPDNQVFLIDFDKSRDVHVAVGELRDLYVRRWRRAIIKHRLPEELSEIVCLKLRAIA